MARKSKDIVTFVDGVKITQCAYRGPKKVRKHSRPTSRVTPSGLKLQVVTFVALVHVLAPSTR